jgi:hypothetical protein
MPPRSLQDTAASRQVRMQRAAEIDRSGNPGRYRSPINSAENLPPGRRRDARFVWQETGLDPLALRPEARYVQLPRARSVVRLRIGGIEEMSQYRRRARKPRLISLGVSVCLGSAAAADCVAANTFDGVYHGTQRTILTNNSAGCAHIDHDLVLRIQNDHFTRRWDLTDLSVDVAADGSFEAKQLVQARSRNTGPQRFVQIKGQIMADKLEADIGSNRCAAHLSLKKS